MTHFFTTIRRLSWLKQSNLSPLLRIVAQNRISYWIATVVGRLHLVQSWRTKTQWLCSSSSVAGAFAAHTSSFEESSKCHGKRMGVAWGALSVWLAGCSPTRHKPTTLVAPSPAKATSRPYVIERQKYTPQRHYELVQTGMASFYGGRDGCHGSLTATGERFNMFALTAAHKTLPLPCMILVENLENNRKIVLRVNDRGPYRYKRILDVSSEAARRLGFHHKGVARIRLRTLVKESLSMPENQPKNQRSRSHKRRIRAPRPSSKAHYYIYVQPCPNHAAEKLKKRLKDWGQIGIRHCCKGQSHVVIGPYTTIEGAQQIARALLPHYTCNLVPEHIRPVSQSRVLRCQNRACGFHRSNLHQPRLHRSNLHRPTLWQEIQAKNRSRPMKKPSTSKRT